MFLFETEHIVISLSDYQYSYLLIRMFTA